MTAPKKTIASEWEAFSAAVYPRVSGIQREECRRAFYAGVASLYNMLMTQVSPGDEVTEEDTDMLMNVHLELDKYATDLVAGAMRRGRHGA